MDHEQWYFDARIVCDFITRNDERILRVVYEGKKVKIVLMDVVSRGITLATG